MLCYATRYAMLLAQCYDILWYDMCGVPSHDNGVDFAILQPRAAAGELLPERAVTECNDDPVRLLKNPLAEKTHAALRGKTKA